MQKIVTTTAQNTKISPNSPARKSPGNGLSPESLGRIAQKICRNGAQKKKKNSPTRNPGETSPFRAMNKYEMYLKNQKIQNICNFFFQIYLDIVQKVHVNQMKPT